MNTLDVSHIEFDVSTDMPLSVPLELINKYTQLGYKVVDMGFTTGKLIFEKEDNIYEQN